MTATERAIWLRSDRFLARSVAQPMQRFLHVEASGGLTSLRRAGFLAAGALGGMLLPALLYAAFTLGGGRQRR